MMSDWTEGYVTDMAYTSGYYADLNPMKIRLSLLNAGIVAPEITASCELGFGQGVSSNIHAAAQARCRLWGTDFNPSHAGFAQAGAAASGSGAQLFDQSFAEFCGRSDLPDFDFIALHGVWSWTSAQNRSVIVDFIRRKLKVGGIAYISYNALPGGSTFEPVRHLLARYASTLAAPGAGMQSRIDSSMAFVDKLIAANPAYTRLNPQLAERVEAMKSHPTSYLAHEYFNRDWQPMHFADVAEAVAPAKLDYAGSADLLDLDAFSLTQEQQALVREIPSLLYRETVRDFIVNRQFRRDCWVKGARQLNALERDEALRAVRVVLAAPRDAVAMKVPCALGEVNLDPAIYRPILDLLRDHAPRSLGELEAALHGLVPFALIQQAVVILVGTNTLGLAQDDAAIAASRPSAQKLNRAFFDKARSRTSGVSDIGHLASPVTGAGIAASRFEQLFLRAMAEGEQTPANWADHVWRCLEGQRESLLKDGKPLAGARENRAELTRQAVAFAEQRVPLLRALQVI